MPILKMHKTCVILLDSMMVEKEKSNERTKVETLVF